MVNGEVGQAGVHAQLLAGVTPIHGRELVSTLSMVVSYVMVNPWKLNHATRTFVQVKYRQHKYI